MLETYNWNEKTRVNLNKLILENSFKNKKVIFDFDNTTVSRDIGEATFAYLLKNNKIAINEHLKAISPSFIDEKGNNISIDKVIDLSEYYEKIITSTNHKNDQASYIISYGWIVQIMQGLTPYDIIDATKKVFKANFAKNDRLNRKDSKISITEGKTSYLIPFFHDEMIDLIGNLILKEYDIYFVSGSNSWTIRYMTTKELPKLLKQKFGKNLKIKPENVIGVNTLIKDKRNGKLYKDYFLVKENKKYAEMNEDELKNYELTNQLVSPLSGFDGKTANIMSYICQNYERPFLALGDSSGDFSMLNYAENRIWFARMENNQYQKDIAEIIKKTDKNTWFIQPVLTKENAGFVSNNKFLNFIEKDKNKLKKLLDSLKYFKKLDILSF